MEEKAKEITDLVMKILSSRGGFDGWWGYIDEETQLEILKEIEEKIDIEL